MPKSKKSAKNANLRKHFNNWKKSNAATVAIDIMKKRQLWMCPNCFADISSKYHIHHLFPISKMEEDDYVKAIDHNNLVLLCPSCNLKQGNKVDERFE